MPSKTRAILTAFVGTILLAVAAGFGSGGLDFPSETASGPSHGPQIRISASPPSSHADDDLGWQADQEAAARAAAIAALEAAEAQALADRLAEAVRRSLAAVPAPQPVATSPTALPDGYGCGGVNQYAAYIYYRESGCNPAAVNGGGCRGIGQACPGSKLPCGDDFACQHAWFEGYALARYGSWEAAYNFWIGNHWW